MQTWAILIDAYRELNARKLFWLVLIVSALIVIAFAVVGLNEKGLTILWFEFPSPLNSTLMSPAELYKLTFVNLGIKFWLGWLAAILALVSTAGIIPEFVSGGAIELTLSKPIGRVRLFLTKYFASLLFVALQVGVFTLASFLVIGIRGGEWEPGLFLAVPLMLAFFSYLYCVCALLGLLTRSTIASLLLTLGFWFAVFGLHATEQTFLGIRVQRTLEVESGEKQLEKQKGELAELQATVPAPDAPADESARRDRSIERLTSRIEQTERDLAGVRASETNMAKWQKGFFLAKTALPKTSETTELLERVLIDQTRTRLAGQNDDDEFDGPPMPGGSSFRVRPADFRKRILDEQASRSTWWILGTSLGFEAIILGIACWIFARRDF